MRNGSFRKVQAGFPESTVKWDDGSFIKYVENEKNKLFSIKNEAGVIAYSQDEKGRLLTEGFQDDLIRFEYNENDLIISVTYPSGYTVKYEYDSERRLNSIQAGNEKCKIRYAENDTISEIAYPNGNIELQNAKIFDRIQETVVKSKSSKIISNQKYKYDNLSQLTEYYDVCDGASSKKWQLSYDNDSHLTTLTEAISGKQEIFFYDLKGNLIKADGQKVKIGLMDEVLTYGRNDVDYDELGNVTSFIDENGHETTLKFNERELLRFANKRNDAWEYWYDGLRRRTKKSNGRETYNYFWAGETLMLEEYSDGQTKTIREYIYIPKQKVPIGFRENDKLYWTQVDARGAIIRVYDDVGEIVWCATYTAFGKAEITINKVRQPWRLMGQYFDEETELHYSLARYYSPYLKMFLSVDPLWTLRQADNYAYASNDPYNKVDANGYFAWAIAAGIAAGAVVGGLIGGAIGAYTAEEGQGLAGFRRGFIDGGLITLGAELGTLVEPIGGTLLGAFVGGTLGALINDAIDGKPFCLPCAMVHGLVAEVILGIIILTVGLAAPVLAPVLKRILGGAAEGAEGGAGRIPKIDIDPVPPKVEGPVNPTRPAKPVELPIEPAPVRKVDPKKVDHIFRKKEGHFAENTPENVKTLENTANDPKSFLGKDGHGNDWHATNLEDGSQVWTQSRNGKIINGGINKTPKSFSPKTGLSAETKP